MYFPDDMIVDQSERFIVAELIREKTLTLLRDEIPHGIAVEAAVGKGSGRLAGEKFRFKGFGVF